MVISAMLTVSVCFSPRWLQRMAGRLPKLRVSGPRVWQAGPSFSSLRRFGIRWGANIALYRVDR